MRFSTQSIFFKISLLFLFALISFFAFSWHFIKYKIDDERQKAMIRYRQVASVLSRIVEQTGDIEVIERFLKGLGFEGDEENKAALLEKYHEAFGLSENPALDPESTAIFGVKSTTVQLKNRIYILLQSGEKMLIFRDNLRQNYGPFYIIMIGGLCILGLIFVVILNALLPLRRLQRAIRRFSEGREFSFSVAQNDEISDLANEFLNVITKINALTSARSLFLRSIMHELKTPITKGRIVTEMIPDPKAQARLLGIFLRLGNLIDDFAKIEQLASKNLKIEKKEFFMHQIIDEAKKMLLLDADSVQISLLNPKDLLIVDFELFTMAIKNLLDNALKYSINGRVVVDSAGFDLVLKNEGPSLKHDLSEYFKPYFKDDSKRTVQGFGLGMYIIKNTLDAQDFPLNYYHENGVNFFVIRNCIVEKNV